MPVLYDSNVPNQILGQIVVKSIALFLGDFGWLYIELLLWIMCLSTCICYVETPVLCVNNVSYKILLQAVVKNRARFLLDLG